nr:ATP-grasp domain-containing protein [Chloroflexota bacterium]
MPSSSNGPGEPGLIQDPASPSARALSLPRGIVILYSAADKLPEDSSKDILADLETIATAQAVAKVLQQHTQLEVHLLPVAHHVERKLAAYPPDDYVVFNLFEGLDSPAEVEGERFWDEEARAAFTLQELGYRFTGADGHTLGLALNKAEAKRTLQRHGVLTPPWCVFAHPDEVSASSVEGLTFPVIVKPVAEDSSLGIDENAVVNDLSALRARVAYLIQRYHQHVLVETFIDGREFNISIWGNPPQVLPLAEVDLSALGSPEKRIVSFAAKWEETSFEYTHTPVICPAIVSDELAQSIRDTALLAWQAVGGRCGYGRVDMRVRNEQVYVLEVNPNPSLAPDAGFARAALAAGFDYAHMILKILSFVMEDLFVHYSSSRRTRS